jgi:hypothetical protein
MKICLKKNTITKAKRNDSTGTFKTPCKFFWNIRRKIKMVKEELAHYHNYSQNHERTCPLPQLQPES